MIAFIELHYHGEPMCIRVSAIQRISADECGRAMIDIEDCQSLLTVIAVDESYTDVKTALFHEPHKIADCVWVPQKKGQNDEED